MLLSSDVSVSLGRMTMGALEEWSNGKQEITDLLEGEWFQEYVREVCGIVRKHYREKSIQIQGLQDDEGKSIIEGAIKQEIIIKLAEATAIASITGQSWNEVVRRTIQDKDCLQRMISNANRGIISLINGKISLAKAYSKDEQKVVSVGIANCWLPKNPEVSVEIGIYPIGKLEQWANSKTEFKKALECETIEEKINSKFLALGKMCENKCIARYYFEDLQTVTSLKQSIRQAIIQKFAEAIAIAGIAGEKWESVLSRTISSISWLDEQINNACKAIEGQIERKAEESKRVNMLPNDITGTDGELESEPGGVNFLNLS